MNAFAWKTGQPSIFCQSEPGRKSLSANAANSDSNTRTIDAKRAAGEYVQAPFTRHKSGPKPKSHKRQIVIRSLEDADKTAKIRGKA